MKIIYETFINIILKYIKEFISRINNEKIYLFFDKLIDNYNYND